MRPEDAIPLLGEERPPCYYVRTHSASLHVPRLVAPFPLSLSLLLSSPTLYHFANTLVSTHTSLVWTYFGAKKIDSFRPSTHRAVLFSGPRSERVDREVHLKWSTEICTAERYEISAPRVYGSLERCSIS